MGHLVLVALYLRGAPHAGDSRAASRARALPRRRWPEVVRVLRTTETSLASASDALYASGSWQEAISLAAPGVLEWARRHRSEALTPFSPAYPQRWLRQLGSAAPPAVWARHGELKPRVVPLLGVVGSRSVSFEVAEFARAVAGEVVRLGFDLVSGGAEGCDRHARAGATLAGGPGMTLAPAGLNFVPPSGGIDISLAPPDEPFSVGAAMERNALIYAASEATVVVHARLREGGAWHGATDALRRRLCPVLVREDPSSPAHRALIGLGAHPISTPADLASVLAAATAATPSQGQGQLFAFG